MTPIINPEDFEDGEGAPTLRKLLIALDKREFRGFLQDHNNLSNSLLPSTKTVVMRTDACAESCVVFLDRQCFSLAPVWKIDSIPKIARLI